MSATPPKRSMTITAAFLLLLALASQASIFGVTGEPGSEAVLQSAPARAQARKNPYAGNEDARLAGSKLFQQHCAECHGQNGQGRTDAPSLQTELVRTAPPGALLWFLKNGNLRRGMPSWSRLPEARLWQIVTHLQDAR